MTQVSGYPAGYELCHQVLIMTNPECLSCRWPWCRSGVTITASYALKQSARLLKVWMSDDISRCKSFLLIVYRLSMTAMRGKSSGTYKSGSTARSGLVSLWFSVKKEYSMFTAFIPSFIHKSFFQTLIYVANLVFGDALVLNSQTDYFSSNWHDRVDVGDGPKDRKPV